MTSRDMTAGSSELPDDTDEFDFESVVESALKPNLPAAALVAMALLRRVLQNDEWLKANGVAIVVITPNGDFVEPTAMAWRQVAGEVRRIPDRIKVGKAESVNRPLGDDNRHYFEVRRVGEKSDRASSGNDSVSLILSGGRTVVGFAPGDRFLPSDLVRSADYRVTMPQPDWSAVASAITALTGEAPTEVLSDSFCRMVTASDLTLASRPNQSANDFVGRLMKLVQGGLPADALTGTPAMPTLDCVHGMPEAVAWGLALARDLAEFHRGRLDWADIDRGILLVGRPGTGKTSFMRSLARTCSREVGTEVPLIAGSYAQWQAAGHLGDMLREMRKAFEQAAAETPSILFIDEIDSFGDRAEFRGDYADYSRQTVNALLECLDGVAGRRGVIVAAATNDPSRLDAALVRPGRLDRTIRIPLPDETALLGIFLQHLRGNPVDGDLTRAARAALGATGADVEKWCRGARRVARTVKRGLHIDDLLAEIRTTVGAPPSAEELRLRAAHEAGHAYMIASEGPEALDVVSIRQIGAIGGITIPERESVAVTVETIRIYLRRAMAGRAAEIVLLGVASAGCGGTENSDLAKATILAVAACTSLGLVDEFPLWLGRPTAEGVVRILTTRPDIAARVTLMLDEAQTEAVRVITVNRGAVQAIADALMEKETLDGPAVTEIIRHHRSRQARRRSPQSTPPAETNAVR